MNKVFAILLAMIVFVGIYPCPACAEDLSAQTDEELLDAYRTIRIEIAARGYSAEGKKMILDENGIQIYINGDIRVEESWLGTCALLPVIIINSADRDVCIQVRDAGINGWACDAIFSPSIPAYKKIKEEIKYDLEMTDVETLAEIEDIEFRFDIFDDDTWEDILEADIITLIV